MKYYINEEKTEIIAYDTSGNQLLGKYKEISEWEVIKKEVPMAEKVERRGKGRSMEKSQAIRNCILEGLSVKETIKKLKGSYHITAPDVYQLRSKIKKDDTSGTFTGPGIGEL